MSLLKRRGRKIEKIKHNIALRLFSDAIHENFDARGLLPGGNTGGDDLDPAELARKKRSQPVSRVLFETPKGFVAAIPLGP